MYSPSSATRSRRRSSARRIPPLIAGRDLLGQAATGTGKTAAFALPMLQRHSTSPAAARSRSALVLVPTRELAMQVAEAIFKYGRVLGVNVVPVYGGQPIGRQLQALDAACTWSWPRRGAPSTTSAAARWRSTECTIVVLDEADEMLDMGFADDIESILEATPDERQTVLFSATMPAAHQRHRQALPARPGADHDRAAPTRAERTGAGAQTRLRRAARPQAGGARPHPRHRGAARPRSSSAARASRSTS